MSSKIEEKLKELKEKQYNLVKLTRFKPLGVFDYYLLPKTILLITGIASGVIVLGMLVGSSFSASFLIGLAIALGGTYLFDYKGNYLKYPFTLEDETVVAKLIIFLKKISKQLRRALGN